MVDRVPVPVPVAEPEPVPEPVRVHVHGPGRVPFLWSVEAEDVRSGRGVIALIGGGRSVFRAAGVQPTGPADDDGSFFVESRRGEVVVQVLAELEEARVFVTLRFDLSRDGEARALRGLSAQDVLTLHAFDSDGAPLGTAEVRLGDARRAWIASALERASRGAAT